jgi:hypothetical protein
LIKPEIPQDLDDEKIDDLLLINNNEQTKVFVLCSAITIIWKANFGTPFENTKQKTSGSNVEIPVKIHEIQNSPIKIANFAQVKIIFKRNQATVFWGTVGLLKI